MVQSNYTSRRTQVQKFAALCSATDSAAAVHYAAGAESSRWSTVSVVFQESLLGGSRKVSSSDRNFRRLSPPPQSLMDGPEEEELSNNALIFVEKDRFSGGNLLAANGASSPLGPAAKSLCKQFIGHIYKDKEATATVL